MSEINLKPGDKEVFLNTINKQGFFLEERVFKILFNTSNVSFLKRSFLPQRHNQSTGERIEIDLVCATRKDDEFDKKWEKNLIIECKKTYFSWVFSKSLAHPNVTNLILEDVGGMRVKSLDNQHKFIDESRFKFCFSSDMSIMINEDNTLDLTNKKEVRTSRQEVHEAVRQVLHNTMAFRHDMDAESYEVRGKGAFFIPVIVTNARLFYLNYSEKNIDDNCNIKDYDDIKEVQGIVYNFPEVLGWANTRDEEAVKSVFIINQKHFKKFLDWIKNFEDVLPATYM